MQQHNGSLLMQLCLLCACIIIIVQLTIPTANYFKKTVVRAEIEKLYALFFYLQQRAQVLHQIQMIEFSVEQQQYRYETQTHQLPHGVIFGFLSGAHGPPAAPTAPLMQPITFPQLRIIFYPDGTMQSGTIYLTDDKRTIMYALTNPIGHAASMRLYRYDGNWILLQ